MLPLCDKVMLPFCDQVMLPFCHKVMFLLKSHCSINLGATGLVLLLQMLLCCSTLYIALRVILSRHSQGLYEELTVWLVSGKVAVHRPNVLWSTPPTQKSTIKLHQWNPCPIQKMFVSDRFKIFSSRVSSHCTFPQKHCTGLP